MSLFFSMQTKNKPTLELVSLHTLGVVCFCFIFKSGSSLSPQVPMQAAGIAAAWSVRVQLCLPLWKEADILKFLMRTYAVALKNVCLTVLWMCHAFTQLGKNDKCIDKTTFTFLEW